MCCTKVVCLFLVTTELIFRVWGLQMSGESIHWSDVKKSPMCVDPFRAYRQKWWNMNSNHSNQQEIDLLLTSFWTCLRVKKTISWTVSIMKEMSPHRYEFLKHIIPNENWPALTRSMRRDWALGCCCAQVHMGQKSGRRTLTQRARKRQKMRPTRIPCCRSGWVGLRAELRSLLRVFAAVRAARLFKRAPRRSTESAQGFPRAARASLRWVYLTSESAKTGAMTCAWVRDWAALAISSLLCRKV